MKQKSVNRKIASLKKKTYLPIKQRLEQIIEVSKESEYAEGVAEKIGIAIHTLVNYSYRYKIKLPPLRDNQNRYNYINPKRNKKRDRLIRRGLSIGIIGKKTKVHRERARQYISGTGQYKKWRQSRKYYKENKKRQEEKRKEAIGVLVSQIDKVARRRGFEEDKWAYEKTEEYFRNLKKEGKYSFETIFNILKDYHKLQEKGKGRSLDWFAEKYNLWPSNIGNILKGAGLPTLCRSFRKQRVTTPKYKKQCLERAVEVEIPIGDIAYFLELPYYTLNQFFSVYYKGDKKRPKVNSWIKQFGNSKSQRLTYRDASQIYELSDEGFSKEDIIEGQKIDDRVYDYAIEAREEISKHIINSLRIIFPDKNIERPYREFSFEDSD